MNLRDNLLHVFVHENKVDAWTTIESDVQGIVKLETHVWDDMASLQDLVQQCCDETAEPSVLIAAGGDGSLSALASTTLKSEFTDCILGIVPLGTGNDFATAAGIPTDDPSEAINILRSGPSFAVDIGQTSDQYFVNAATIGVGAKVTAITSSTSKMLLGSFAYILSGVLHLPDLEAYEAEVSGTNLHWKGKLLGIAIANGRRMGGGFKLTPDAAIDDGLLDVVILPDMPVSDLLKLIPSLRRGDKDSLLDERLVRARVHSLKVTTESEFHINLDGEPSTDTTVDIKCIPQRLKMILPMNSPLLSRQNA